MYQKTRLIFVNQTGLVMDPGLLHQTAERRKNHLCQFQVPGTAHGRSAVS